MVLCHFVNVGSVVGSGCKSVGHKYSCHHCGTLKKFSIYCGTGFSNVQQYGTFSTEASDSNQVMFSLLRVKTVYHE